MPFAGASRKRKIDGIDGRDPRLALVLRPITFAFGIEYGSVCSDALRPAYSRDMCYSSNAEGIQGRLSRLGTSMCLLHICPLFSGPIFGCRCMSYRVARVMKQQVRSVSPTPGPSPAHQPPCCNHFPELYACLVHLKKINT